MTMRRCPSDDGEEEASEEGEEYDDEED